MLIIKKLTKNDKIGVQEIDQLTQRSYLKEKWDRFSFEEKQAHLVSTDDYFQFFCNSFSQVAYYDESIVGFLFADKIGPSIGTIYIHHVAVNPDMHRQGVGESLIKSCIVSARRQGAKKILSLINPDNPPSIKLHQKVGFKIVDWKKAVLKLDETN